LTCVAAGRLGRRPQARPVLSHRPDRRAPPPRWLRLPRRWRRIRLAQARGCHGARSRPRRDDHLPIAFSAPLKKAW